MEYTVHRDPPDRERDMMLIIGGPIFFQAVMAAKRLGIFSYLAAVPGASREKIASNLGLPLQSVRTLLMAIQAIGWITRDEEGGYHNLDWVTPTLAGEDIIYDAMLEGFEQILYRPFSHLTESLRAGKNLGLREFPGEGDTLYERLQSHPEKEAVFHRWMSSLSSRGLPALMIEALHGHKHVLDVGGGAGTNASIVAQAHPELHVTIMDLPSICKRAEENVAALGLSDRITTHACDIRTADLLPGCDAVMYSRIFNIYSEEQNQLFVQRAADVLPEGGKLLVYPSMVADDDESGPLSASFLSLYFLCLATGEGRVYTPADYEVWFSKAGFSRLHCTVDDNDDAVLIGTK